MERFSICCATITSILLLLLIISDLNQVEADKKLAVKGPDGKVWIVGVCRGAKNGNCAPGELEQLKANWEKRKRRMAAEAAEVKKRREEKDLEF